MAVGQWKIAVDTGGTFTDCVARDPEGAVVRAKVPSDGRLKFEVIQFQGNTCSVGLDSTLPKGFFDNWLYGFSGGDTIGRIQASYPDEGHLVLDAEFPSSFLAGGILYLSTCEEAPVLGIRILTQTALGQNFPSLELRLGSTKGTNALLERKIARNVLLVTEGFRDLLLIGNQQRPHLFDLNVNKPDPFYDEVIEVRERITAEGAVELELSASEIDRVIALMEQETFDSVGISLLNAYKNPVHEHALLTALKANGYPYITTGTHAFNHQGYLSRTSTVVINSAIHPVIGNYLSGVQQPLGDIPFYVMTSAGGLEKSDDFLPKDSLLSGPAGGIVGAQSVGKKMGKTNLITFDMGGTSTDVSRIQETHDLTFETTVAGATVYSPGIAIETVASGGGSICWFDGYKLRVGPESAGAFPGPACYGNGGPLTLTDVNLLLGRLQPDLFGIPIKLKKAEEALEQIQKQLSEAFSRESLLLSFLQIANEIMADAVRKISVRKGYDPSEYGLVAFGGAGGMHAADVANLLGIEEVVLPFDGGVLSAQGIADAFRERIVTKDLFLYLDELPQIAALLDELIQEGSESLPETQTHWWCHRTLLFLRLEGQNSSLEIPYEKGQDLLEAFRKKYHAQYGHWVAHKRIELTSVRLLFREFRPTEADQNKAEGSPWIKDREITVGGHQLGVYFWDTPWKIGNVPGPAAVLTQQGSTYIPSGWHLEVGLSGDGLMTQLKLNSLDGGVQIKHDSLQLALFGHRFMSVADEMGALLQRTAFSVNVKDRLDFSCAFLNARGELVANAPHIPVHLGALSYCVRACTEHITMEEGDVIVTNHPGFGGSHLPDVTLIAPVYFNERLMGYVANRAHHAEVGGVTPGSMPPNATSLEQEGVVLEPMYLVQNGVSHMEEVKKRFISARYPSRDIAENEADLLAALASIQKGIDGIHFLCRTYGASGVLKYADLLLDQSEQLAKRYLLAKGSFKNEVTEFLDDGTTLSVKLEIEGGGLHIDFDGTSPQHPRNFNANPAIVTSTVVYVMKLLVGGELPLNDGLMRVVELSIPNKTMLNPEFSLDPAQCPAVVAGNVETSQRVVDTLLKGLELAACSYGTMNNVVFGNERFGYYETVGGGVGATNGHHGADAVHQHMTNTRITDPEIFEARYPVFLRKFAIRRGSGGEGVWKGGNGVERLLEFREPVSLTVLAQHRREEPYGMKGGQPGEVGDQGVYTQGNYRPVSGTENIQLAAGDRFLLKTPGGGGWGAE